MAFRWRSDDGPLIVVLFWSFPSLIKLKKVKFGPRLTELSGSAHEAKVQYCTIIGLCWVLLNIKRHIDRRGAEVNMFITTPCFPKHKSTIVLLYNDCMLCIFCHFGPLKPMTLWVEPCKITWRSDVISCKPYNHINQWTHDLAAPT